VDFLDAPVTSKRPKLTGHQKRAHELLVEVIDSSGLPNFDGVPPEIKSVPEGWWRDRFYERGLPGAEQDTKKRTFRRAADKLVEMHRVGINKGRVWLCH